MSDPINRVLEVLKQVFNRFAFDSYWLCSGRFFIDIRTILPCLYLGWGLEYCVAYAQ